MIPRVFDFGFFFTFMDCTVVPWGPLSLLVVPLVPINGPHHWPVIRWFYSIFDFDTFIRMLEFIIWSCWDGAQDLESCLIWLKLCGVVFYSWLYTCFSYADGCDHTVGLYTYDYPSILDGYVHTLGLRFIDDHFHLDGWAHAMDLFI